MQVVINISHNLYESVLKGYDLSELGHHELYKAVQNGARLLENHENLKAKLCELCEDAVGREAVLEEIRAEITELD